MRNFRIGAGLFLLLVLGCACQAPPSKFKRPLEKFSDLAVKGVRIGIVDPDLGPAGRYALEVIARLQVADAPAAAKITGNIVTHEAHVRALLYKLLQREIDAGFFYRSDALAAADKIKIIEIPQAYAVFPEYSLARIKGTAYPAIALDFIAWLRAAEQCKYWLACGFKPLPAVIGSENFTSAKSLAPSANESRLTIFAAAVFYDVLNVLAQTYREQKGVRINCEFAGSGKLYQRIEQGAQGKYGADIFLSAAPVYITRLEARGLADSAQKFMRNDLVVGVSR